jgi:peptidyl-prolyl cis-trans isomerase C
MLLRTIRATFMAAALLAPALQASAQSTAPKAGNPVERLLVNGQAVDGTRLDVLLMEQLSQGRPDNTQQRGAVREDLIRLELLAQEARKAGIDKQTLARAQASMAFDAVLTRAYLQQWLTQNPVKDDAVKVEYESWKTRMGTQELQLRQVLVASEAEAKAVLARLAKSEKFEDIAAAISRDTSSRTNGGLLGWAPVGALIPSVSDAVRTLTKGQLASAPVNTPSGWHVFRLEDTRTFTPPALDAMQSQIRQALERMAVEAYVGKLRQQAKVD